MRPSLAVVVASAVGSVLCTASPGAEPASLRPPPPTDAEAEKGPPRPEYDQPAKVRPAPGLVARLFAKEPLVQDPVSFCIDERGRIFVAESFRQERGIEDNRSSRFWLLDDLQSQTVEDRLRMYEKWASKREGGMDYYRKYEDRVTRVEDTDGDGKADAMKVFASPFNEPLDGTGAGLIAMDGDVWYTNIPHLWRLRDENGDGTADEKTAAWSGFGVRVALRGHDMHGLTWGPDGKLYWSIGDRGYHVTLPDGRVLADPRSGAVFRCYPDGSGLELFCTGLRNPQELAFDDFGNLFTGDNNSDGGDKARIVYCVEGGETGWRMDYQTLEGSNVRGPWNQEDTWALRADLAPDKVTSNSPIQPAFTIPPLAHVSSGPSGLAYYPGLGLDPKYARHFFLCDFLGGDAYSRVLSFALEPVGAGFKVVDVAPFVENVLPTDIDFGYDGKIYITDWGGGWYSKNAGEIYCVWDPERVKDPRVAEVTKLFAEGFSQRGNDELRSLLGHADRRVRQRAQFALAERGPAVAALLTDVATNDLHQLARIHAMWALGQLSLDGAWPEAVSGIVARLDDADPEIRAQAARVIGDARLASAVPELERGLTDPSLRVRYHAAMALAKVGSKASIPAIIAMLAENDGNDVFIRHAGVWALEHLRDRKAIDVLAAEPQTELRLCAALVWRRWHDPAVARLLNDSDDRVVAEAARAINDTPIDAAMADLVKLGQRYVGSASSEEPAAAHEFTREIWKNVKTGGDNDLADPALFAKPADETETGSVFEGKSKAGDNYLQRVRGVVVPDQTGPYVFSITSDDQSSLYLSPDDDLKKAVRVAWVENYAGRGDWNGQPNQTSQPVLLEAGKRYAVEARHAEGGGDDFVAVGWQRPDGTLERPIGSGAAHPFDAPLLRRVVNACVQSDDPAAAVMLADLARADAVPEPMRLEALAALGEWVAPGPRDRVNGAWRPVDPSRRSKDAFESVLKQKLPGLTSKGSPAVRAAARELAAKLGVTLDGSANFAIVIDAKQSERERAACLRQLCIDGDNRARAAIDAAFASDSPMLRAEARRQLAKLAPEVGVPQLTLALAAESAVEQQAAVVALGEIENPAATAALAELVSKLESASLPRHLWADTLRSALASNDPAVVAKANAWLAAQATKPPLDHFAAALEGGDAERGAIVLRSHPSATCLKCHAIGGVGGDAAPKLDGVGTRLSREKILESLVVPGAVIAPGFGTASAMPAMGTILSLDELRDVVEYLSTVR
ncbi:MAG: HEAT repeat domain-containing protein [Phycisphaerae bacterium]|nr:HEAT repeat domain-containing protein [Phycisphaerae bacterium]